MDQGTGDSPRVRPSPCTWGQSPVFLCGDSPLSHEFFYGDSPRV